MLYEDEFSLANTATISYQWSEKGVQPKVCSKQRNRERQSVFGSLNYETGQMTINFADRGNSKTFIKHLKKVLYEYRNKSKIIMVLDNVRHHHAKRVKVWLAKNPKIDLFFLLPYTPELNAVERAWWYMRKKNYSQQIYKNSQRKENMLLENVLTLSKTKSIIKKSLCN